MSTNEVSVQEFQQRFQVIRHVIDPFERYYSIGRDRISHRRVIIKAYYINTPDQQLAILESKLVITVDLENYFGLKKIEGLCQIICYSKLCDEQIDVAFDFHRQTLEEYWSDVNQQRKGYSFLIKLLEGLSKALSQLKIEEVEVDDIRPSNILLDLYQEESVFRLFYDERQKNRCLSLDNLYLSPQRLEEWSTGNFGQYYFEDKIVYECGLLVLDLATENIHESLYADISSLNHNTIQKKLAALQLKYQNRQLPGLIARMLSTNSEQRPRLEEISHQCSVLKQSRVSVGKSGSKSASHYNFVQSSSNQTLLKQSTSRARIFSELDFLLVNGNTHSDVVAELHKIKAKIDKSAFECKRYQDGSVYYGQLMGNIRQGLGIYTYAHGDIFFGSWTNNSAMQGSYIFQSGETYQGGVKNGKHGRGLYRYANGNIYEGFWENDLKEGKGEMQYSNGDKYDGNWHKGKKHGFGVYQYNNGIRYEGDFMDGFKSGNCTIIFPDKSRFQGSWQDCCIEGFGRMMYQNGDLYEGNYEQSMKNGNGVFKWSNNITYQGEFTQDSLSGKCLIHYPNSQIYDGYISQGIKNGEGMYQYENGDSFRGIWKNDQKWEGRYSFYDGSVFEGVFRENGIFKGRMVYPNGDIYEGQFKYGQRDGRGKYILTNKQVIQGEWRADSFSQV